MYQALYRKWRPKTFSDVAGQDTVTETLRRQVAEGRTSHAYLFTGTRGTGKTTCAKILAKAVNCEHPIDGDPCNRCPSCLGIENGTFMDVLELDAASNNGVDQVRALRDEAIYSPAHVKKRVYIIDEVHMLSTQAFNALLKILEEPPEHLLFILATTELHKVLPTILSRCQRFSFKRIPPEIIARRLAFVAEQEGIDLTADGAELLSRLADGALRDALSLLDQCASVGGTIDTDAALRVLGRTGRGQTVELMRRLLERNTAAALGTLGALYDDGRDMNAALDELSGLVRDLLIHITARAGGSALLTGGYELRTLDELTQNVSPHRLIAMATTLQAFRGSVQRGANPRLEAELCLLRLCDDSLSGDLTALSARIARLEEQIRNGAPVSPAAAPIVTAPIAAAPASAAPAKPAPPSPPTETPPWEEPPLPEEPPQRGEAISPAESAEEPVFSVAPPPVIGADGDIWRSLLDAYKGHISPMYRAFLDKASGVLTDDLLQITCDTEITREKLSRDDITAVLRQVTGERVGRPIRVGFTVGRLPQSDAAQHSMQDLIDLGSQFGGFTVK